jgi:DNA-binding NarL/FixJ family response regulator
VLHRISLGASNKEVARDLYLSPSTVRTHVESVFRKLECSTRAAATLKASSMGLLPSEPTDLVSKATSYHSDISI